MRIRTQTFNTLPSQKDTFWQVVVLPTISILKSVDGYDPYTAVSCEWLFWSCTFLISKK
jgi:hypothetical protein